MKHRSVNRKGRNVYVQHVRFHHWMMRTEAYQNTRPIARALLIEFYALFNGVNNGELFLSVREAGRRLGVSNDTANKYIQELVEKGFIKPNQVGSFGWKKGRATSWILTEFSYNEDLPTKDFMHWRPRKKPGPKK